MATDQTQDAAPKAGVVVMFLFQDVMHTPIQGLSVQFKAGTGTPPAPPWVAGPDPTKVQEPPPAPAPSGAAAAPGGASAPASASAPAAASTAAQDASGSKAPAPAAAGKPAAPPPPPPPPPISDNTLEATTDKDGYAVTITNAVRNQPIDVFVKNRRGEYAWKAKIVPKKDINAFTIISPEFHLEATTKPTPKDDFEQELNLPIIKQGEVMTFDRLLNEFAPYITFSQKATEQGLLKKDFPTKNKEVTVDAKTHKKKTKITIEHHYKVVENGKPRTVVLNVLGSRLNYPKSLDISDEKYKQVAKDLSCEVAAVKAVAMTESHGAGFCANGLPKIRYERHMFMRASLPKERRFEAPPLFRKETNPFPKYPNLCFPAQGDYQNGEKDDSGWASLEDEQIMYQYERLFRACALNRDYAIMACSWGAFQIMGIFWEEMGYASPVELANLAMQGIDGQLDIFVAYCKMNKNAITALKDKNWTNFAKAYNGNSAPPSYAETMGKFYNEFK
ncbi:N-acetylmuramidase family protein [Burkholderia ubonensis]|uniref:N-acetylmuramidase family protein n=1 Tax=Burkholderia ubonensis TaxID=101571 RepID=UPI000AD4C3E3|nr:N-acetylmuramidase family protein [Burkholderia ubonensis]